MARRLADEWGVTIRQVYRDREAVLNNWGKNLASVDRQVEAARMLEEVRALRSASATKGLTESDAGLLRCAVQLMSLEVELLNLKEPTEVRVSIEEASPIDLAKDVIGLLPFVSDILGLELNINQGAIEASYREVTDGNGD